VQGLNGTRQGTDPSPKRGGFQKRVFWDHKAPWRGHGGRGTSSKGIGEEGVDSLMLGVVQKKDRRKREKKKRRGLCALKRNVWLGDKSPEPKKKLVKGCQPL